MYLEKPDEFTRLVIASLQAKRDGILPSPLLKGWCNQTAWNCAGRLRRKCRLCSVTWEGTFVASARRVCETPGSSPRNCPSEESSPRANRQFKAGNDCRRY